MIQNCQVYINIECWELYKAEIVSYLKGYLKKKENLNIYGEKIKDIEIAYDAEGLIVIDINIDVNCTFVPGYPSSRWEPGEFPYIEDFFTAETFRDWIKDVFKNLDYDVDISIDESSYIPSEEELIEKYCEERYNEEY